MGKKDRCVPHFWRPAPHRCCCCCCLLQRWMLFTPMLVTCVAPWSSQGRFSEHALKPIPEVLESVLENNAASLEGGSRWNGMSLTVNHNDPCPFEFGFEAAE